MRAERHLGAIRGATTAEQDEAAAVRSATAELLRRIVALNDLRPEDILSALFTVTPDLRSAFPAHAARELGWTDVAMLCTMEIPVPGAITRCVRVLLHVETTTPREHLRHVYLRGARSLRPEWADDAGEESRA
ncbi:MAG TPA: chorismate mutase [Gemmatimonadaceae bacterium]|nr:chorismate mutase [Gemmatimonadaceae bacterium]